MKRLAIILFLLAGFSLAPQAQQRRKPAARKTATTSKKTTKKSGKTSKSSKTTKQPTTVQALEKQRKQIQRIGKEIAG